MTFCQTEKGYKSALPKSESEKFKCDPAESRNDIRPFSWNARSSIWQTLTYCTAVVSQVSLTLSFTVLVSIIQGVMDMLSIHEQISLPTLSFFAYSHHPYTFSFTKMHLRKQQYKYYVCVQLAKFSWGLRVDQNLELLFWAGLCYYPVPTAFEPSKRWVICILFLGSSFYFLGTDSFCFKGCCAKCSLCG